MLRPLGVPLVVPPKGLGQEDAQDLVGRQVEGDSSPEISLPLIPQALPSSQETKLSDGQVLTPLVGSTPWLCVFLFSGDQVSKHLWKCVIKKMEPFLETSGDRLPEDCPVKSKLGMGMIVLFLMEKFNFLLLEKDLASLCHLLCLDTDSLDAFPKDLKDILETSQR